MSPEGRVARRAASELGKRDPEHLNEKHYFNSLVRGASESPTRQEDPPGSTGYKSLAGGAFHGGSTGSPMDQSHRGHEPKISHQSSRENMILEMDMCESSQVRLESMRISKTLCSVPQSGKSHSGEILKESGVGGRDKRGR